MNRNQYLKNKPHKRNLHYELYVIHVVMVFSSEFIVKFYEILRQWRLHVSVI